MLRDNGCGVHEENRFDARRGTCAVERDDEQDHRGPRLRCRAL